MTRLKNLLRTMLILAAVAAFIFAALPAGGETKSDAEPTEALEVVSSYPYTTTTKVKVNLRAGRSVRSTLVKKIPAGAEITVKSVSTKTGWATVEYGKYSGYVKS